MDKTISQPVEGKNWQTVSADDFSSVKPHRSVLRQVVLGLQANQHRATADTKTRGEVRGGGKKPWRQKGTGRARVGSSRTPVWRKGGIVFGPSTLRNYAHTLPVALKRQALATALALKAQSGQLHRATLTGSIDKTKTAIQAVPEILALPSVLLVFPDLAYSKAFRNISHVHPMFVSRVSALDIAQHAHIVFVNDAYDQLKSRVL